MQAVLFDLDGIITDTAEYHYLAWKSLAGTLGIEIDREFNEQLKGVSRVDSLAKILEFGEKDKKYSSTEKETLMNEKNELYLKRIQKMTPQDLLPGIYELLQSLKSNGYKIGLSSASKNGPMILNLLKIADFFDVVANPDSIEKGKPAPDIFLKGAELLNVSSHECVGIEDANSGITAILAAEMVAIGVGSQSQLAHADLVLSSTEELNVELIEAVWQKFHK